MEEVLPLLPFPPPLNMHYQPLLPDAETLCSQCEMNISLTLVLLIYFYIYITLMEVNYPQGYLEF